MFQLRDDPRDGTGARLISLGSLSAGHLGSTVERPRNLAVNVSSRRLLPTVHLFLRPKRFRHNSLITRADNAINRDNTNRSRNFVPSLEPVCHVDGLDVIAQVNIISQVRVE